MHKSLLVPVVLVLSSLLLGGCNLFDDDDDNNSTTTAAPSVYAAVIAGIGPGGQSGKLSISLPATQPMTTAMVQAAVVTATGSLTIGADSPVPLSGAYDSATGDVMVEGGGYAFTGQLSGTTIAGTYTGPGGSGSFSAARDATPTGFEIMLGDWAIEMNQQDCESSETSTGFIRFTFDGDQLVLISNDGFGNCEVDEMTGSLQGNTFHQIENRSQPVSETCTAHERFELSVTFSESRFDATVSGDVDFSGTECPASCPFSAQVVGTRCTDCFPECTTFEEARLGR